MSLIDDTCDGCGERFDPMGDPHLVRAPRPGEPWRVLLGRCATTPTQADERGSDE